MKSAAVPTVFIIDDDRGMRQAIQDLVESVGLRAEAFATGQDFLRKQLSGNPSCLVLDVRLPQLSGLDFQCHLAMRGQLFCCPHFLPAVDVSTTNHQQLLAPPVPRRKAGKTRRLAESPHSDRKAVGRLRCRWHS